MNLSRNMSNRPKIGLVALTALTLLGGLRWGWTADLTVSMPNQQVYSQPSFTSPVVAPVPQGAQVTLVRQEGDWYQINFQGKVGWLHRAAVAAGGPSPAALPGLLTAKPVQPAQADEVALAGKGFTPEVEAGFRQKNPGLNYAQVEAVERLQVDPAKLSAFLKEGGLN